MCVCMKMHVCVHTCMGISISQSGVIFFMNCEGKYLLTKSLSSSISFSLHSRQMNVKAVKTYLSCPYAIKRTNNSRFIEIGSQDMPFCCLNAQPRDFLVQWWLLVPASRWGIINSPPFLSNHRRNPSCTFSHSCNSCAWLRGTFMLFYPQNSDIVTTWYLSLEVWSKAKDF